MPRNQLQEDRDDLRKKLKRKQDPKSNLQHNRASPPTSQNGLRKGQQNPEASDGHCRREAQVQASEENQK